MAVLGFGKVVALFLSLQSSDAFAPSRSTVRSSLVLGDAVMSEAQSSPTAKLSDAFEATTFEDAAREFFLNEGFYGRPNVHQMSDDFVFLGPVVGPLSKEDYLGTVGIFKVYDAFPDLDVRLSKFTQDPEQTNRYWGILRVSGTHTGVLNAGSSVVQPTGNRMDVGPQAVSVTFGDDGKVTKYTGGYVVDYREGDTQEAGAMFAVMRSVGMPAPRLGTPKKPGKLLRIANWLGAKMKNFPKGRSHANDLPSEWKDFGRTHGLKTAEAWDNTE